MRLGLASSLAHKTPTEWAEKLAALGCRAVVFPLDHTAGDSLIADYVSAASRYDLLIAEVGIWKNVFALSQEERQEARKWAVGQLRMADQIGARCCVNIAGTYGGPIWDGGYSENFTKEAWDLLVDYTKSLLDEVKPERTEYSLEPMPWMYPTGPEEYLQLIKDVDRPNFGIHLDLVNMINSPERFFHADEFMEECFDKLGDKVKSCHLKDIRLRRELTFQLQETYCGNGVLNIEKYVSLMDKYDKDMPVIIEHLETDEEYIKSLTYVKERLDRAGIHY